MEASETIDLNDLDVFDEGVPHDWFRYLREHDPVYWQDEDEGSGYWCVTKYADLVYVSCNPQLFSSWEGGTNIFDLEGGQLDSVRALMLNMDPPRHGKFRRIVSKGFTPRRIEVLRRHIKELATTIVDGVAAKGECDFVDEVAAQLPMQTICELLGVPEGDRRLVYELSNRLIGFDDPEFHVDFASVTDASLQMFEYASSLAAKRREEPGDDLVSVLVNGEVDGAKLNDLEFNSFFLLLALAGNETTRTVTSQGMRLLIEHPQQRQHIVERPELLATAVEEILRYNPAVIHFRRTATEDLEMRGRLISRGDKVVLWYPSVNRDEEVFDNPDLFNIRREPNEHLAFGIGEHFCLGANLARLQLNTIFSELLRRIPDMEFDRPVRRLHSNFVDGIKEMRVRFTPEKRGNES
ncbi:MAG: cytochrome P450 [Candidatus Binatia bacterium]